MEEARPELLLLVLVLHLLPWTVLYYDFRLAYRNLNCRKERCVEEEERGRREEERKREKWEEMRREGRGEMGGGMGGGMRLAMKARLVLRISRILMEM